MGGEIEAGELHIESLLQDPLVLVCRRDDEFAKPKSVGWASLAGRRMVMLNNTSGSRQQIADTLTSEGVKPQVALELAQPSSVLAMVEANLGVAVVPRLVAPDLDSQSHQAIGQSHDLSVKTPPAASAVWSALHHLFGKQSDSRHLRRVRRPVKRSRQP